MKKNTALAVVGGVAGLGAAAAAVGLGTIVGRMAYDAFRAERAVDDGPDDLLAMPADVQRQQVVSDDGTRLNVETYGPSIDETDDDIVVMIHGWTCNTAYWNPQINHLSGRPIVAYDQRGHGRSELGRARPTVAMLGRDLNAVLTAMIPAGRRAILVGHSMGGMTIMSWAGQFPDRVPEVVSQVVLTSTAALAVLQNHKLIPENLPRYTRRFEYPLGRMIMGTPLPLPHTAAGPLLSHHMTLGPRARKAHLDFVDDMILSCAPRARAGWGSAMGKLDVIAGLEALTVPTTVVVGTNDRLTPPSHSEQMAAVLERNGNLREFVTYPGVGHMLSIENHVQFNSLLDDLLI